MYTVFSFLIDCEMKMLSLNKHYSKYHLKITHFYRDQS